MILLAALILLLYWRSRLKRATRDLGNCAWSLIYPDRTPRPNSDIVLARVPWLVGIAGVFRKSNVRKSIAPHAKAFTAWSTLIAVPILALWLGFQVFNDMGVLVRNPEPLAATAATLLTGARTVDFHTKEPCQPTNIVLRAGERYDFFVTVTREWRDAQIPADPNGFTSHVDKRTLFWAVPFRRSCTQDWFELMGSIDCEGDKQFPIGEAVTNQRIAKTGRLHLYINDAACHLCWKGPWRFYGNNHGTAKVTVKPSN